MIELMPTLFQQGVVMAKKGRPNKIKPLDEEILIAPDYGDRYIELFDEMSDWEDDDFVKEQIKLFGHVYNKLWPSSTEEELIRKVSQHHVHWYQNEIFKYYKEKPTLKSKLILCNPLDKPFKQWIEVYENIQSNEKSHFNVLLEICIRVIKDNFKQYLMTGLKHFEIDPEDLASEILLNLWRKGNFNSWTSEAEKYAFLKQEIKGYLSDMNKPKEDGEGLGRIDKNIDYSRNYFSESYKQSKLAPELPSSAKPKIKLKAEEKHLKSSPIKKISKVDYNPKSKNKSKPRSEPTFKEILSNSKQDEFNQRFKEAELQEERESKTKKKN